MAVRADSVTGAALAQSAPRRGLVRRVVSAASTLISVVVAVAGGLALVLAVATHLVPSSGAFTVAGHPVFVVLSGSMTPVIDTGDLVIDQRLTPAQAAQLHAGQIITFHRGSGATPITHRIVKVTSSDGVVSYTTKGDANQSADLTPVHPDAVVGLFQSKIPMGGRVIEALRQPLTLALLLAAPALWLLSGLFFAQARELDAKAKQRGRAP